MKELPYIKIEYKLRCHILNGSYQPGQKLPSIRAIAEKDEHNPATVRHALVILQQQGLIYSKNTKGYFVTVNSDKIAELRYKEGKMLTAKFKERFLQWDIRIGKYKIWYYPQRA